MTSIMQTQSETILTGYSDQEKGAYLGAIASMATADRSASVEEIEHLRSLAQSAGLSQQQEAAVLRSASETSGEDLIQCLDVLKTSELRFSLVTDLIALAKVDGSYSDEEKLNIQKVSKYLGIDNNQFSTIDQFVNKTTESNRSAEEVSKPGFFESLGMKDQFANSGINMGGIGRGLFGMLGPMLLGGLVSRGLGGGRGGLGGGLLGGGGDRRGMGGGFLGGGGMSMPGGLGSILSGFNRGRNNQSLGGMLGRLLR
jgi:uncharacterized tellurite resistance protein B-like protein